MKLSPHRIIPLAAIALFTSLPSSALAVDYVLSFGSSQDLNLMPGDQILVDAGANRSYTCEGVPLDIDTDFDFSTTITGTAMMDPETVTARAGGAIVPGVGGEAGGREDNRVIFTPTKTDRYQIPVASTSMGGENVRHPVRWF